MTLWTHVICEVCWSKREPGRVPHQVMDDDPQRCCFCGASTSAGIYVRENPTNLKCGGRHDAGN